MTGQIVALPERKNSGPRVSIPPSAYAELAVTTNFSFLRGASDPEELVEAARQLGLAGLGIADRNNVAGVVRAHVKARELRTAEHDNAKFKVAVGARLVFSDETPDILAYPRDRAAWGRLTRLLSLGKRRADKGDCILRLSDLLDFIEGLNLIVVPPLARDPEKACPGLDPGWKPVFGKACPRARPEGSCSNNKGQP